MPAPSTTSRPSPARPSSRSRSSAATSRCAVARGTPLERESAETVSPAGESATERRIDATRETTSTVSPPLLAGAPSSAAAPHG